MPKGVYERTEEHLKKLREYRNSPKGKEHMQKFREAGVKTIIENARLRAEKREKEWHIENYSIPIFNPEKETNKIKIPEKIESEEEIKLRKLRNKLLSRMEVV